MATIVRESGFTVADLTERFGAIPLWRIRREPAPGSATERDLLAIHAREKRLCELVDGILVTAEPVLPRFKLKLRDLFAALDGR